MEAKAKALAKAEELIAKVKAGEDFETAANEDRSGCSLLDKDVRF